MAQAFKLRMPEDLREKLDREAERSGRSLNAEIVARLETSCGAPGYHPETEQEMRLLDALRLVMRIAGRSARRLPHGESDPASGGDWPDDGYAYSQAMKAAVTMLDQLRPGGSVAYPGETAGPLMDQMLAELGVHYAHALLAKTKSRGPTVIDVLGPLAQRLAKEGDAK